ncbi:MAG: hypothetical protein JW751_21360 [Polyangiaceae bacterium]|nr:hypothetical protein [Polyangiaceae bacterium]
MTSPSDSTLPPRFTGGALVAVVSRGQVPPCRCRQIGGTAAPKNVLTSRESPGVMPRVGCQAAAGGLT